MAYHFRVTMALTSDIDFRIIVSGAYLILFEPSVPLPVLCISPIFFEVGIPNLVSGCIFGPQFSILFFGHFDLDLSFRIIVSGAYLLYYLS